MFGWKKRLKREIDGLAILGKMALRWRPNGPEDLDEFWGVCPHCKRNDGYLNLGRSHWFICHRHRVRWCVGYNLFGTWLRETHVDWEDNLARIGEYAVLEWMDVYVPDLGLGDGDAVGNFTEITRGDE